MRACVRMFGRAGLKLRVAGLEAQCVFALSDLFAWWCGVSSCSSVYWLIYTVISTSEIPACLRGDSWFWRPECSLLLISLLNKIKIVAFLSKWMKCASFFTRRTKLINYLTGEEDASVIHKEKPWNCRLSDCLTRCVAWAVRSAFACTQRRVSVRNT